MCIYYTHSLKSKVPEYYFKFAMKGFIIFGFLIAAILQAECRSTPSLSVLLDEAYDTCEKSVLNKVDLEKADKRQLSIQIGECAAMKVEIINDHGVLNTHRLEDFVLEQSGNLPKTTVHNAIRKCADPNGRYKGEKLVQLGNCLNSRVFDKIMNK